MAKLTAENHGPRLNISMWIIMVPTVLMVASKIATKWFTVKKIGADDILLGLALLAAIAQSVAITEEVKFGLGRRQDTVSTNDMNKLLIAQYVSNIFYVISIYTTKLSTAKFFLSLCSSNTATRIVSWLVRSMVLWIFISVITLLAQCHLPHPWNSFDGKCIDLKAFWTAAIVVDGLTQTIISLLPVYLVRGLQISKKSSKWLIMVIFGANFIVLPLAILRVLFLFHAMDSTDYTWNSITFGIFTSFHPFVSIMVSSLPFIKPVLDSLVLQPYLIAVEEPQSIIPSYSKGASWAQKIQESRIFNSQQHLRDSKPRNGQNNSSVHWPYTQRQGSHSAVATKNQDFEMANYPSIS